jgi:hypothetical protein
MERTARHGRDGRGTGMGKTLFWFVLLVVLFEHSPWLRNLALIITAGWIACHGEETRWMARR